MQGPTATEAEVLALLDSIEAKKKENANNSKKSQEKADRLASRDGATSLALTDCKKTIAMWDQNKTGTEFYSTYPADMIEEEIVALLNKQKIEPDVNETKYKIKF